VIINGGSRSNGAYFATHLMRADHNERVEVVEIRGLAAENVRDAFLEMKAVASGTKATRYFYHANLNTREDEKLTPEQWQQAVDTLERELGLTDQPRFVVLHDKEGRVHEHVVWSRINADTMTAISDSLNYQKHEQAARALETAFGHEPVESVLEPGGRKKHPEHNPSNQESLRGSESKIDPKAVTAEVTELWKTADSGTAFAAALEERGFILVRGDKRDFCIVDAAGDEHSLTRRIDGVRAAAVRERMADVERDTLPSVAEGRALARSRLDTSGDAELPEPLAAEETTEEEAEGDTSAAPVVDQFDLEHEELVARLQAQQPELSTVDYSEPPTDDPAFDAVHNDNIARAIRSKEALDASEAAQPGGRFERLRSWFGGMSERFQDWRGHLQERYHQWRGTEVEEPTSELPAVAPPEPQQDMPEL
jgi:hypothetical protein